MKKLILSALLFTAITFAASAQTTTGQGGNSADQTKDKTTEKTKTAHSKTKAHGKKGTMHTKTKGTSDATTTNSQ